MYVPIMLYYPLFYTLIVILKELHFSNCLNNYKIFEMLHSVF
jgi:hypothetical protein